MQRNAMDNLTTIGLRTQESASEQPSRGSAQTGPRFGGGRRQKTSVSLVFATANANRAFENLKRFRRTWGWATPDPDMATEGRSRGATRGIERAAIYPDSHLLHFSVLAGLVLVEGLANAYFFSTGSDLGLLGGWLQAITVSFTNVLAAFFLVGFLCLRHLMNPRKIWFFIPALIGLPIAIGFIIVLNLAAAHYRDMLELNAAALAMGGANVTGHILAPIPQVFADPFGLQTLEAYLLLTLGLTFAVIAAFKGRTFDDAIPGYGVVHRRADRAARELKTALDASARSNTAYGALESEQIERAENLMRDMLTDLGSDRPGSDRFA